MSDLPCGLDFLSQVATDLGIQESQREIIATKAELTLNFYQTRVPTKSASQILDEGQNCLRQETRNIVDRLGFSFLTFLIVCVVIIFVFGLAMFYMVTSFPSPAAFVIILFVFLLFCLALAFYFTYQSLTLQASEATTQIKACATKVVTDLENYETIQETAVSDALCFYADL